MTAGPTRVFVPSIYGQHWYGTIYYGGQWVLLIPPPVPPPPPTPPPSPPALPPAPPPTLVSATSPPPLTVNIPAGYGIGKVNATSVDYFTIAVTWTSPAITANIADFRVLRSRYGFPVDQNDGTIIFDSETSTDNFVGTPLIYDQQVIPGQMHYYGIYILLNLSGGQTWYRAGFAAVLAPEDLNSSDYILSRIPEYFTQINPADEITTSDDFGDPFLNQFVNVLGWGEDYLRTQIQLAANVNDPNTIPINWLVSLAGTLGFPYYAEISPAITREAMANYSALVKERGTLQGIEASISQLTSWGADISVGYNMMLEDDQCDFIDPEPAQWNSLITYDSGEYVNYQGFEFQANQNIVLGTPPFTDYNPFAAGAVVTPWVVGGGTPGNGTLSAVTNSAAPTGCPYPWALKFILAAGGGAVAWQGSNTFSCTPGNVLTITAQVNTTGTSAIIGFDFALNGSYVSAVTQTITVTANTWTQVTAQITVPSSVNQAIAHFTCAASETIYATGILTTYGNWTTYPWTPIMYSADPGVQAGPQMPVAIPLGATTVASTNPNKYGVYLQISGGSVSAIAINGTTVTGTSGYYFIPASGTVTLTYTVAPTTFATTAPTLLNQTTYNLNTWEPLIDLNTNQAPAVNQEQALQEVRGIFAPATIDGEIINQYDGNGLLITNLNGSTSAIELRSISRTPSDIAASNTWPNTGQIIGDGIPVPFTNIGQNWDGTKVYPTGSVVQYQGMPFHAVCQSVNVTPPSNGVATNEWQPIGFDPRIALMLSGYTSQLFNVSTAQNYAVVPYMLWFDQYGNFINSVYMPTSLSGNAQKDIVYDSFSLPSNWGSTLTGRSAGTYPDIIGSDVSNWVQQAGTFNVNAFGNGCIAPSSLTVQTLATMNAGVTLGANVYCAVTLSAFQNTGNWVGLVIRWASNTSYIRVDQNAIVSVNGSTITVLATHSTQAQPGDRLMVLANGTTITAYINGSQVSTTTSSFNQSATIFGVVSDVNSQFTFKQGKPEPEAIQMERITTARTRRRTRSKAGKR